MSVIDFGSAREKKRRRDRKERYRRWHDAFQKCLHSNNVTAIAIVLISADQETVTVIDEGDLSRTNFAKLVDCAVSEVTMVTDKTFPLKPEEVLEEDCDDG